MGSPSHLTLQVSRVIGFDALLPRLSTLGLVKHRPRTELCMHSSSYVTWDPQAAMHADGTQQHQQRYTLLRAPWGTAKLATA